MVNTLARLVKQSSIYGIGAVVTPLIGFIMLPLYTRALTPEDYGVLAITTVLQAILSITFTLGMNAGLARIYFSYDLKAERQAVIVSSIIFSGVVLTAIVGVLWGGTAQVSALMLDVPQGELFVKFVLLASALNAGVKILLSALRAEERALLYTGITIGRFLLTLTGNILFVIVFQRKVRGVLEAGLISHAISYIVLLGAVLRGKKLVFSFRKISEILAFGLPLLPAALAAWALNMSNRYFLKHYATVEDVGLFSLGYKMASILNILITQPFRMAWGPYMYSVAKKPNAKEIYKRVLVYFVFVAVWCGLGLSVCAEEALILLTTPEYYPAAFVVPLLVVGAILRAIDGILVAGIHLTNKTHYASLSFIITAGFSLVFNYVGISYWGMFGAALATMASHIILNVLYFTISQKLYPIRHEYGRLAHLAGLALLLYGASLFIAGNHLLLNLLLKGLLIMSYPFLLSRTHFYTREEEAAFTSLVHNRLVPGLYNLRRKWLDT